MFPFLQEGFFFTASLLQDLWGWMVHLHLPDWQEETGGFNPSQLSSIHSGNISSPSQTQCRLTHCCPWPKKYDKEWLRGCFIRQTSCPSSFPQTFNWSSFPRGSDDQSSCDTYQGTQWANEVLSGLCLQFSTRQFVSKVHSESEWEQQEKKKQLVANNVCISPSLDQRECCCQRRNEWMSGIFTLKERGKMHQMLL